MRQGQQSRRGRGRGRKPQNQLSRNLESNGPDVKIRGTASHIAEKYSNLARDALSSGEFITAENYLQHAEHYQRIIQAAQTQQVASGTQQGDANGSGGQHEGASDAAPQSQDGPSEQSQDAKASANAPSNGSGEGEGEETASANGSGEEIETAPASDEEAPQPD